MATIGSISVSFESNIKGLETGIEDVLDLFDDLSDAADELSEKLGVISDKSIRVRTSVDTRSIDDAEKRVGGLADTVRNSSASIAVTADTEQAQGSVSRLSAFLGRLRSSAASPVDEIKALSAAAESMAEEAGEGSDELKRFADGSRNVASSVSDTASAAGSLVSATSGVSQAISGWTTEYVSLENAIDRTLTAVGRSRDAATAATTAIATLAGSFGGTATILAAFGGSAVAAAAATASLASGAVGAAASLVTYASIMGLARAATANMSEESQRYAETFATVTAVTASVRVGLLASSSVYRTVAEAIGSSSTAAQFFSQIFTGLSSAVARGVTALAPVAAVFSRLTSALTILSGASNENMTGTGFAALVARVAASSAATGAAIGGITALASGCSVLSGAAGGALGAVAGLSSTFPVVAPLAIAAAVATGRFSHELEELSVKAQQVEQMADRFGAPRQEIEKLRMAAANTGVGLSQLAKGQQAFYTSLSKIKTGQLNVENVREAKLAFDKLGISMSEVKSRSPDQVFALVAEELQKIEDPAKKTQLAFDLFGKQGAAILPALKEFGELSADFDRLGGSISNVDFTRFISLEQSFDRLKAATSNLSTALITPFVPLQQALNNFWADIRGGATSALAPIATLLADATKPFAVLIEITGRFINILLRIVGVATTVAAGLQIFSSISAVFDGIGEAVMSSLAPIETMVAQLQAIANVIATRVGPVADVFTFIGQSIGVLIGGVIQLAAMVAVGAAAWTVYSTVLGVVNFATIAATVNFALMWAAALAPVVLVVAGLAAIGAILVYLGSLLVGTVAWFLGIGDAVDDIKPDSINATTASVDELAAAAEEAQKATSESAMKSGWQAVGEEAGLSAEQVDAAVAVMRDAVSSVAGESIADRLFGSDKTGPSVEEIKKSVEEARGAIGDLTIDAARFGTAGADAANEAQSSFNELQKKLASGQIDLPTFEEESKEIASNLRENLKILADDSPEVTLKKNLELFKQLDDAAKSARKSVRDIGADVQIGDKIFPRSSEVKARAKQFQDEYVLALEEIKKKQQAGDFGRELTAKKKKNEDDFKSGRISKEQFQTVKLELDSTSAQEQASNAAEDVQREFERKKVKLEADLSFADSIRKELETAFLSPVEKFQKELKKIQENPELTQGEKAQAETNIRNQARESLIGKNDSTKLFERQRDIGQAVDSGLISEERAGFENTKAMDEFAASLGVVKTPFDEFSSSLDNIAEKFGFVGQPIDEVRKKLEATPEKLALFDKALKESRDKLLQSLGIEKTPEEVFQEQMKKISEAENATDPNKRITKEQADQARAVAERNRNKSLGAGDDMAGQFAERQAKINEAFGGGKDDARLAIANNALEMDKRKAAGLDATPTQQLKAGVDKINDAFGVTGQSMAEIQASLSPQEFEEYQEALKKNNEAVKASLGVEKSGAEKLAESRTKLEKAVKDNVITEEEKNKALREQRNQLLSSLGIPTSPAKDFEDAVTKIKESASELTADEIASGLKAAKDKLLDSLGIDKPPAEATQEAMKRLNEAFKSGAISADEFAKGSQKAKDTLLQSLGIPADSVNQLKVRLDDLQDAFSKRLISEEEYTRGQEEARRTMLPGGEQESPVKKFQRDIEAIDKAVEQNLISGEEGEQRRKNLQAQLQEDLAPALDRLAPDRRAVESSDARSKGGVDTFFRILRGNDNPSLKAQLEIARNTRLLAEAADEPEAAPVLLNMQGR